MTKGNRDQIRNVDLLIAKKKFLKRFKDLFVDLQSFSINGHFKQTVQRFRSCLQPDEAQGETQLPFLSYNAFCDKADKDRCVLCQLSAAVQCYWVLCTGDPDLKPVVDDYLTVLEGYAENGRKAYQIAGRFPHFYLRRI